MRRGKFATTLAIHACPKSMQHKVADLLSEHEILPDWVIQELVPEHVSAQLQINLSEDNAAELASELYLLGVVYFEMNQVLGRTGVIFMGVPGLGVYRGELNEAGSIMLSEDRINLMVNSAAGNHREFMRLLRVSLGQSWDDIIEPFRGARFSNNVFLLNRVG